MTTIKKFLYISLITAWIAGWIALGLIFKEDNRLIIPGVISTTKYTKPSFLVGGKPPKVYITFSVEDEDLYNKVYAEKVVEAKNRKPHQ